MYEFLWLHFIFPRKNFQICIEAWRDSKKLLLCLLPLYDPQWAFVFSPTSNLSLDKQSCILKFSLALLSVLLTKKYILDPKLIFFLLSCSTFLVRTADTIIYKKSDFEFVLPMKIIWKNPSSKVRYFFNIIFNFHYFPGWPNDLKGKIPFLQKPLIQDFVSRLSTYMILNKHFFLTSTPIYCVIEYFGAKISLPNRPNVPIILDA